MYKYYKCPYCAVENPPYYTYTTFEITDNFTCTNNINFLIDLYKTRPFLAIIYCTNTKINNQIAPPTPQNK